MIKKILLLAAVSIMALVAIAYADMNGRGRGSAMTCGCSMDGKMMDSERHLSKMMKGLNLDEQQKTFMGEIKSKMKKETIKRTADMRIAQIELRELLSQETADMKAVEAKVKQLELMRTDMHLFHIKAMEECKAKLTPEQRKKFKEMIEAGSMMEGMGMGHGRGMKMGKKHRTMKEKTE